MTFEYPGFIDGATPDRFLENEVTAYHNDESKEKHGHLAACRLFRDEHGLIYIDFRPKFPGTFTELLDEQTIFSLNEEELSLGRYSVAIAANSRAGMMLKRLLEFP